MFKAEGAAEAFLLHLHLVISRGFYLKKTLHREKLQSQATSSNVPFLKLSESLNLRRVQMQLVESTKGFISKRSKVTMSVTLCCSGH